MAWIAMCDMDLAKPGFDKKMHLTSKRCEKGQVRPATQQASEEGLLLAPWLINTEHWETYVGGASVGTVMQT